MKRKELFKSLILTALVISSVVLASKIWFSKELWSGGYNSFNFKSAFFSKISSLFGKKTKTASLDYDQIFFPKQYMVCKSGQTVLLRPTDDQYSLLSEDIKKTLADVLGSFSVSETNESEFRKASRTPSVFVDFYNYTSLNMLADYFGIEDGGEISEINNIKHLLISAENSAVYVKNDSDGKFFKLSSGTDFSGIDKRINTLISSEGSSSKLYSYAFENSFDVAPADGNAPKRLLLDPYIIINIQEESVPGIKTSEGKGIDQGDYGALLAQFGMNLNTSRRFSEKDGTVNLVENFAALKIKNGGFLEYDCISSSKGISLNSASSDYDIIKSAGEFLEKISAYCPLNDGSDYVFSKITRENATYTVYFDITYNGIPVLLYDEKAGGKPAHSVSVTVRDSKIINYRHALVAFESSGSILPVKNMITALDEFYGTYDTAASPNAVINDMYNTYYCSDKGGTSVKWVVSLSNSDSVVIEGGI